MNTESQALKLIALLGGYRDEECNQLLQQAEEKSRLMINAAHRDAREHVHQAVQRERLRALKRIRSAEARLHTQRRASRQRVIEAALSEGWQLLQQGLIEHWRQPASRQCWIQRCARESLRLLADGDWQVTHPADLPQQDQQLFEQLVSAAHRSIRLKMVVSEDISAGLTAEADSTVLDMSVDGLLNDREMIEGRFLALLNKVG